MDSAEVPVPEGMWMGSVIGPLGYNMDWLRTISGASQIDQKDCQATFVIKAKTRDQLDCAVSLLSAQLDAKTARGSALSSRSALCASVTMLLVPIPA